jgi:hypothetical protein
VMLSAGVDYLYEEMENADYLINLATLKAHARAGVTLTAKNHFGSHSRGSAGHLHTGLVSSDNDSPYRTEYGMYRVLTDVMGHEKLGGNTLLFIVEGLWGGPEATEKPIKWDSAPFNGDWPNSILASQDAVALESVCFDFLKAEFNDPSAIGKDRPWYGAVDDHLHQAADPENWPEDFTYDPEGDGTPMGSMGVHEHWNNEVDKLYSRNLGKDYGIQLIGPHATGMDTEKAVSGGVNCYPNPFSDLLHVSLKLENGFTGSVTIQVFSMSGTNVLTQTGINLLGGDGMVTLHMEGEPAGNYILQVDAGGDMYSVMINKK